MTTPAPATPARQTDAPTPHHALVVALLANAVAAVVKLGAFAVTGASVLLSEGLHSVADCGNQGALLLGHRAAATPASARYPLGVGRVRYLWAFLVAVVIFGGSALVAFAEATYRLLHPGHPEHVGVTLAALAVAVAIEAVSIVSAVRHARPAKGDAGWVAFISASRDPDLPVLLVEDLADLVGLVLALAATILVELTGAEILDVVASYLIGFVLSANAVFLAWEMASLVLGETAEPDVERAVLAAVAAGPPASWRATGVQVVHLGPTDLLIVVQVARRAVGTGVELAEWLGPARKRAAAAAMPLAARVLFEVDDADGRPPG